MSTDVHVRRLPWPTNHSWEELRYPFPLSDGTTAWLYLPRRLSVSDAGRITAFLNSLVTEQAAEEVASEAEGET